MVWAWCEFRILVHKKQQSHVFLSRNGSRLHCQHGSTYESTMGGEWIFLIQPKVGLSQEQWQSELIEIQKKFARVKGLETDTTVFFAGRMRMAESTDNVFAQFTYTCNRHGEDGMWCLPWDPWKKVPGGHIHARCAPPNFARYSYEIQRHLENAFPESILIEWGDGLDGYSGRLIRSRGYRHHFPEHFPEKPRPMPRVDISDLLLDVRSQLGFHLFDAITREDEEMVLRLVAEDQLDIDFVAPYGREQEILTGGGKKRCFVRKVSAVRLAVEQLVNSPYQVDHEEVACQLRILYMILSCEPKLEFPKLRSTMLDETADLARHVVFDAVGYHDAMSMLDGPVFVPLQSGHAEVRIRMTLLRIILPAVERKGLFQKALEEMEEREFEWLLHKKPGWQLMKILQEFEEPCNRSWERWCIHDGLSESFMDDLHALELRIIRQSREVPWAESDLFRGSPALTMIACRKALAEMGGY